MASLIEYFNWGYSHADEVQAIYAAGADMLSDFPGGLPFARAAITAPALRLEHQADVELYDNLRAAIHSLPDGPISDEQADVLANLGVRDNDFDPARTAHFGRIFNRPPRPPADPNAPARPPRDGRILKMIFEYLPMILQLLGTFGVIPKLPTP